MYPIFISTEKYSRITWLLLRLPCFASVNDVLKPAGTLTMIGYKLVCDVRNTSDFKPSFWIFFSL